MVGLREVLDRARKSPEYKLARHLASNDFDLLEDLVKLRNQRGLRQDDVANLLGISQQAVSKFESHGSDPKLSTVRMYATAIGALVSHDVQPAEHDYWSGGWRDANIELPSWQTPLRRYEEYPRGEWVAARRVDHALTA